MARLRSKRARVVITRGLVLAVAFVTGGIAAHHRWPVVGDIGSGRLKDSRLVRSVFELRPVKKLYYSVGSKLGFAAEGAFFRARSAASEVTPGQQEQIDALRSIGYLAGREPAPEMSGVTVHDPARAYPGVTLITDGYRPEALLLDMDGNVLHRWSLPFERAFPDSDSIDGEPGTYNWRRVKLVDDGGLLANFEGRGLIKLDRRSNLVWAFEDDVHHDMEVLDDESIYALVRTAEMVPRFNESDAIMHDSVVHLSADGVELDRVSILKAIETSPYSALLDLARDSGDIFHANEIDMLDGRIADRIPAFADGNLLVTLRNLNTIIVLDPGLEQVVWALTGLWVAPHAAVQLDDGGILIFDNLGDGGKSRVVEFDPVTQDVTWAYRGSEHDLFSRTCGDSQRLPNGNTLITESNFGRVFEVTPELDIVWEYFTPDRAGRNKEMIASLYDAIRFDRDARLSWLDESPAN